MASDPIPKLVSEPVREREALKFVYPSSSYGATLLDDTSPEWLQSGGVSPGQKTQQEQDRPENATGRPSASKDTVITSLAQLGLWRTGTDRALISLFDRNNQYIVAETTRQSSLSPKTSPSNPDDEGLWLQSTTVPRQLSVCDQALMAQANEPDASSTQLPLTLIPDLSTDPRLSQIPHALSNYPARFYAAVPIRSPTGVDIGVYCVVDPSPRTAEDWKETDTQVLREVSSGIMDYMHSKSVGDAYRRSVRMARGIGSFFEQESTMTGWRSGTSSTAFRDDSSREGALNPQQQALQQFRDLSLQQVMPVHLRTKPTAEGSNVVTSHSVGPPSVVSAASPNISMQEAGNINKDKALANIFSRAANLIREGIETEGVVFLDANFETSAADSINRDNDSQFSPGSSTSSDEAAPEKTPKPEDSSCGIFGFSTSSLSSVNSDPGSGLHAAMPMKLLTALLRRYPTGKIFNFDENGEALLSGSSEEDLMPNPNTLHPEGDNAGTADANRRKRAWSRASERTSIASIFPGALSVAFVPVWDPKRDRWLAGGFAYTLTPTRTFTTEGELSYLRAFGILAASEAQQLEALLVNKAQADVLGSLSHELRTPLHGIILAAELLADTQLDVFQGNLLRTLETCGRTLSETIDHLLYFSKVNQAAVTRKRERRARKHSVMPDPSAMVAASVALSEVRLDALVEEVMDSVFAGHVFRWNSAERVWQNSNKSGAQFSGSREAPEETGVNEAPLGHDDQVAIFLDIDPYVPYRFCVAAGALRRVVMNLFGNALKYTRSGTIKVSLSQKPLSRNGNGGDKRVVRIVVKDTGQGISEDFLRNDLFKPFAQENHLSNGTGLGLSLVKKIVASMGGKISIESGLNKGTTATVTLPLNRSNSEDNNVQGADENEVDKEAKRLKGLRMRLLGFPSQKEITAGTGQGIPMEAMQTMCHSWLQMEPIDESHAQDISPDLVLCNEVSVDDPVLTSNELIRSPVVVICANAISAHRRSMENTKAKDQRVYEFVSQPIGPHKLARILHIAFRRWGDLQALSPVPIKREVDPMEANCSKLSLGSTAGADVPTEKPAPVGLGLGSMRRPRPMSPSDPAGISPQPAPSRKEQKETVSPEDGPKSFLLVDDNPINLSVLCAYMKKLGRKYATASDGQEAVDRFQENPTLFSCILMDISMPRLDGIEATKLIRAFEQERQQEPVSIFALTGLASAAAQQEAYQGGMDVFLSKPVKLKQLSGILKEKDLI
ncbi:hypothetical protein FZEAL_537 [Fusarium zealandicum]|uniref:histidine kinase n=1 Tax=Fusarium zealandicum TaxID=1053134 RepID=A0A8H4UUK8_9HYPO|nr:hypothetical protein FZEAL_537 [Fusarium zealandicum]